jgi:hypothetical protein
VTLTAHDWSDQVRRAALAGDRAALILLYSDAEVLFGEHAAEKWAELLSAYDASAQTG